MCDRRVTFNFDRKERENTNHLSRADFHREYKRLKAEITFASRVTRDI